MRWGNFSWFLATVIGIVVLFSYCISPLAASIKQGLDLQGGTHVVLEAVDTPEAKVDEDAVQRVIKIVGMRVNELGLTEPIIQREGSRRIIVELPGIKDPEKAIQMLGKTALLEFKDERGATVLTGKDLKEAQASLQGQSAGVDIEFSSEGAKTFADLTAKNVGKPIGIYLDKQLITNPVVHEPISGGKARISGKYTMEEAQRTAILLRSGALPVKVDIIETRTVGPTLGLDSKEKSEKAFAIGIGAIILFMLLFYRLSGFIANISLLLYVLLFLFAYKMLNATLTLPSISGFVLSMGMAVDANVLIFERFKEEYRAGKSLRAAMDAGFSRAFSTIMDSNVNTLLAAIVLYTVGTGAVKGFAITLGLGILLSMFTAVFITCLIIRLLLSANAIKNGKVFGA